MTTTDTPRWRLTYYLTSLGTIPHTLIVTAPNSGKAILVYLNHPGLPDDVYRIDAHPLEGTP